MKILTPNFLAGAMRPFCNRFSHDYYNLFDGNDAEKYFGPSLAEIDRTGVFSNMPEMPWWFNPADHLLIANTGISVADMLLAYDKEVSNWVCITAFRHPGLYMETFEPHWMVMSRKVIGNSCKEPFEDWYGYEATFLQKPLSMPTVQQAYYAMLAFRLRYNGMRIFSKNGIWTRTGEPRSGNLWTRLSVQNDKDCVNHCWSINTQRLTDNGNKAGIAPVANFDPSGKIFFISSGVSLQGPQDQRDSRVA